MRAVAFVTAAAAALLVPAALAAPPPVQPVPPIAIDGRGTLAVQASPSMAGARPAELRLTMHTELQCGSLGPGPVVVVLPGALRVPGSLAGGAVLLNGVRPAGVAVSGHVVSIATPRRFGLQCDVMAPGTVTIAFTRLASLGNPLRAGTYHVTVRAGRESATAPLVVA